jgi:hypothetical protein
MTFRFEQRAGYWVHGVFDFVVEKKGWMPEM